MDPSRTRLRLVGVLVAAAIGVPMLVWLFQEPEPTVRRSPDAASLPAIDESSDFDRPSVDPPKSPAADGTKDATTPDPVPPTEFHHSGRVVDSAGEPIAGATITATAGTHTFRVRTGHDGRFFFTENPGLALGITVTHPAFSGVERYVPFISELPDPITLRRPAALEIVAVPKVPVALGETLPVVLDLHPISAAGAGPPSPSRRLDLGWVESEQVWRVRLSNCRPGPCVVTARFLSLPFETTLEFELTEGRDTRWEIELPVPDRVLEVIVTAGGRLLPGAQVEVWEFQGDLMRTTQTDENGAVSIPMWTFGPAVLVRAPNLTPAIHYAVPLAKKSVQLDLVPTVPVDFHLRNEAGDPVTGTLTLTPLNQFPGISKFEQELKDGHAHFDALPQWNYSLFVPRTHLMFPNVQIDSTTQEVTVIGDLGGG